MTSRKIGTRNNNRRVDVCKFHERLRFKRELLSDYLTNFRRLDVHNLHHLRFFFSLVFLFTCCYACTDAIYSNTMVRNIRKRTIIVRVRWSSRISFPTEFREFRVPVFFSDWNASSYTLSAGVLHLRSLALNRTSPLLHVFILFFIFGYYQWHLRLSWSFQQPYKVTRTR